MASAQSVTWQELTARPRPTGAIRIAYGADPLQHGDLWLPAGKGTHPVVLMVHGGCWQTRVAKADLMDWAAHDLAGRGFAVWNIEYRGVDMPGGGYPGTFRDVAAAADKLREIAREHQLKLDRVVAVGHSAGGHLALWLSARRNLPAASPLRAADPLAIAHVVSLGGLPDLAAARTEAAHACGADTVDRLVGKAGYADTSLPPLITRVPQTLINGSQDTVAPPATAARYVAQVYEEGAGAAAIVIPEEGHFDEIAPGQKAWEAAVTAIEQAF